jgi:presenilin-like A22 family membrane protease
MKHTLKVTYFLMIIFISAQIIGLFLVSQTIYPQIDETGNIVEDDSGNIIVERSEDSEPIFDTKGNLIYLIGMILIGTALVLLLNKFKLFSIWKIWFFLAIFGALFLALKVVIPAIYAIILSLIFAYLKLFKPNILIHNLTELFIYGGIATILYRWFTVPAAILMLIIISIYDMIAVWKLKHMITMAKAQAEQKMFAGILIPYQGADSKNKSKQKKTELSKTKKSDILKLAAPLPKKISSTEKAKTAILGGGDIAFPLIFAATIMNHLIEIKEPFSSELAFIAVKQNAFFVSLIIPLFAALALFLLFLKSEKGKFYPAMPFISIGCIIGYLVTLLF